MCPVCGHSARVPHTDLSALMHAASRPPISEDPDFAQQPRQTEPDPSEIVPKPKPAAPQPRKQEEPTPERKRWIA